MTLKTYKLGDWTFYQHIYAREPTLAVGRALNYAASQADHFKPEQIDEFLSSIASTQERNERLGIKDTLCVKKVAVAKNAGSEKVSTYSIVLREKTGRCIACIHQPIGANLK